MERDNYYLFLASYDSTDLFPLNKPSDFTVALNKPLDLNGKWTCSLVEVNFTGGFTEEYPEDLIVMCDLVQDSVVHDVSLPVLRRILIPRNLTPKTEFQFSNLLELPIKMTEPVNVRIYIRDDYLREPSFSENRLTCTLRLSKA